MRLRALVCALLAIAIAGDAYAQQPRRKKKPKKPKTEQRREAEEEAPEPSNDPPKIDTTLREEDSPAPSTNPWVASGESKTRGAKSGEDDTRSGSSDSGAERKRKTDDEWQSRPIAVSAVAGYASANLRIGMGLRVGYSIGDRFYVGGAFMYHLGTTFGDVTFGGYYPSAELGYDYHLQGFTVRPYAGLGMYFTRVSGNTDGIEVKDGNALAFYPGIQFDYQFGPGFVGVDLRVLFILQSGTDASIGFFAVGGARF